MKRLTRSRTDGKIAGVCAGFADYFEVDVTFVRAAWLILSIFPGALIGGLLAYVLAWLVMPEGPATSGEPQVVRCRLERSVRDAKIAGVCGGLAEYLTIDPTAVRLLWVILTVLPGAIVGGMLVYVIAWIVMPKAAAPHFVPTAHQA
jgi:phage shock protein PspC (stress-responsive transcriptional regulator)